MQGRLFEKYGMAVEWWCSSQNSLFLNVRHYEEHSTVSVQRSGPVIIGHFVDYKNFESRTVQFLKPKNRP